MMVVIAMLSLDLALFRAAMAYRGPDLAAVYLPIGMASQAGLLMAVGRPSGARPFWVGFCLGGIGALVGSTWIGFARPGPVVDLWVAYLARLDSLFGTLPRLGATNPGHGLLHFTVVAAFFLPGQLLLAFAGGILATAAGRTRGTRLTASIAMGDRPDARSEAARMRPRPSVGERRDPVPEGGFMGERGASDP
jgi:hypothetical protein